MTKKPHSQVQEETTALLWESIEDHPAVIWLTENSKNIGYVLAGLLLILILAARLGWIGSQSSEADFSKATNDYALFSKNPTSDEGKKALSSLAAIMKKHPELQAKYDGLIAQNLILAGNSKEANVYLERALKRTTNKNAPLYSDFSRSTILISDNKLKEALATSVQLKEKLQPVVTKENTEANHFLYANNLLIIATLQQKLNNLTAEKDAWKELQTYLSSTNSDPSTVQKMKSLFLQGSVGLDQYIEERLKQ